MHTNAILDHDSSGSAVGYPVRVPAAARRARGIASPGRAPAWAPAAGAARPPARWPRCATRHVRRDWTRVVLFSILLVTRQYLTPDHIDVEIPIGSTLAGRAEGL